MCGEGSSRFKSAPSVVLTDNMSETLFCRVSLQQKLEKINREMYCNEVLENIMHALPLLA